jgi:hypothetical protein
VRKIVVLEGGLQFIGPLVVVDRCRATQLATEPQPEPD